MLRLLAFRKIVVVLCVFSCIALRSRDLCLAQPENEKPNVLPLSTAYDPVPGQTTGKTFFTTVEWQGQEYHASEGTTVLMQAIIDPATDPRVRAKALERLSSLRSRETTAQLIALYDDLRERDEKAGVMACLTWSEDPRGFPLFTRLLDHEKDHMLRLVAAIALAEWNVRRGVEELVALLGSNAVLTQPAHRPYIRDNALDMFLTNNRRKGWRFPAEEIRKSIEARPGLDREQFVALYIAEIKKWFAGNEHRFPNWEPGDPLPAAPKLPPIPPGPEDVLSLSAAFRAPPTIWPVSQEKEKEVSWEGQRYPAAEGVDLLMKVALEASSVDNRLRAIHRLEHLGSQLHNTERIPELMKLYGRVTHRSEKVTLVFCLARSKDQRALPLFTEILDTREEKYLRLPAAYGLALWNARRGVRELIELLVVEETVRPILYPGIISDEAARLLARLNYLKSWWAPEAPLQAVREARTDVHDEIVVSCHVTLKEWFDENKHRFPDWKPGDPLPEVPASEGEKNGNKKP